MIGFTPLEAVLPNQCTVKFERSDLLSRSLDLPGMWGVLLEYFPLSN
jgi:hypothetical protein